MTKPLYKVGDKLTYVRQNRKCTVREVVYPENGHDTRHHGFRYIVDIGYFTWSVPEWTLETLNFDPNKFKGLER
jgi:hypothetical protein